MEYEIIHRTEYRYSQPASEAYLEVRLTPPVRPGLEILEHRIDFDPRSPMSEYVDYFGNVTGFYSMTLRHERLAITNHLRAKTSVVPLEGEALDSTVAEARQILASSIVDVYHYLQPTSVVPVGGDAKYWGGKWLSGRESMRSALDHLNKIIYRHFEYQPGTTDNRTPLEKVWKQRKGVCQDFAHVMLSVLRTAGLPCRYVCGYIESEPPQKPDGSRGLVGSSATHAWVEVLLPGLQWVALDPTNNCWCAEQHVPVSFGRDFLDAAPLRGTFKTSGTQKLKVDVRVKRIRG